jgi:hypothetical protein
MDRELEKQIRDLLDLDQEDFDRDLVGVISQDGEFLATLGLPQTFPAQSDSQAFASLNFKERLRRVHSWLNDAYDDSKEELYELVCVKFEYCKQRGAGEIQALGNILGVLIGQGIIFASHPGLWPVPIVIVYLYKNGFFDRLCQCNKTK